MRTIRIEDIKNLTTPVTMTVTPEESKAVQEEVFRLGGAWKDSTKEVIFEDAGCLCIDNKILTVAYFTAFEGVEEVSIDVSPKSFSSTKEIFQYLLIEGNSVTYNDSIVRFNSQGALVNEVDLPTNVKFKDFFYWKPYVKPNWYENIPEKGILCWVRGRVTTVLLFNGDYVKTQYGQSLPPEEATPLTKEEIQEFLDKAPEGN